MSTFYVVLSTCSVVLSPCGFVLSRDIPKYGLDPGLDFGLWKKKLLQNHPPPAFFKNLVEKEREIMFLWCDTHEGRT